MTDRASDMAGQQFDPQARFLQLDERVTNLRNSLAHLESEMRGGFNQAASSIASLGSELRASIAVMANEIRDSRRTQWPVILTVLGLIVTTLLGFGGAIGILSLSPIREAVEENRADTKTLATSVAALVAGLPESFPTRRETEALRARSAEDRARVELAIRELRESTVSRAEWMERNRARDIEVADLSRRVDEIRSDFGDIYGTRDVIQDLQEQLRRLETQVYPLR